ncbi:MAG: deoxyribose-phosphate aldolase [Planctomycetota bacterium]|jgi:deoxyribose-phosphate aldolase
MMSASELAAKIDHTILASGALPADVDRVVSEAIEHGFASVCVNPIYVRRVRERLVGSGVLTCAVAGFPLGANTASIKAAEAAAVVSDGAQEVDVVANLAFLLTRDLDAARAELAEVVGAVRGGGGEEEVVVKVIVESSLLMDGVGADEAESRIATACGAVREAGADFVKTSTGFHPSGGATIEAVSLMRKHANGLRVKASGGIRTLADAQGMLKAGADRLGCSAGVAIVKGLG